MKINIEDVEKTMSLKLPGSMYSAPSSALLIKTKGGEIYVEDGNTLYKIPESDPEYGYLLSIADMENPHKKEVRK